MTKEQLEFLIAWHNRRAESLSHIRRGSDASMHIKTVNALRELTNERDALEKQLNVARAALPKETQ